MMLVNTNKPTHAVDYCTFSYKSHVHFQVREKEEGKRRREGKGCRNSETDCNCILVYMFLAFL